MIKKIQALLQGKCLRLVSFGETPLLFRRQLLALGLTTGVEVKVVRVAPLGCPVHLEVRGVGLALRQDEARFIEWELV